IMVVVSAVGAIICSVLFFYSRMPVLIIFSLGLTFASLSSAFVLFRISTTHSWRKRGQVRFAQSELGQSFTLKISGDTEMQFAWIPPGAFLMGSNDNGREQPIHKVTFAKGFWMGKYPVTQRQWETVMGGFLARIIAFIHP